MKIAFLFACSRRVEKWHFTLPATQFSHKSLRCHSETSSGDILSAKTYYP